MGVTTREQIAVAVYNLVSAAAGSVVNLVTSSQRARPFTDVAPSEMPALFMEQLPEGYERSQNKMLKLPPTRTMNFHFALYTADHQETSVVPRTQLNMMTDAIEAALAPAQVTRGQTLGGLVAEARIDGKIEFYENVQGDGKSVALIPIAVLRP